MLLRVLQTGEVQRVGSDHVSTVDVPIIASTNRDLRSDVAAGRFRTDLYHRIAAFEIYIPPLRERPSDLPPLVGALLDHHARAWGLASPRLTPEARALLISAPWPGNVRELEQVLGAAILRAAEDASGGEILIEPSHLLLASRTDDAPTATATLPPRIGPLSVAVDEFKRTAIRTALARNQGNWAAAGRELGMHRSNLHALAKRLGVAKANER